MTDYLEALGLSKDVVGQRISFLRDRSDEHRARATDADGMDNDWRQIALWGAAGTCAVRAAQLTLLVRHEDATRLLDQAASDYLKAGMPYGLVLQALSVPGDEAEKRMFESFASEYLEQVDAELRSAASDDEKRWEMDKGRSEPKHPPSSAVRAANQQFYLCFAMAGGRGVASEYHDPLGRVIEALGKRGNLPHGPQGAPLHVYHDLLRYLFQLSTYQVSEDSKSSAEQALRRLALRYHHSLETARRNDYLWKNLWSPVEYLDLEVVAAATFLARAAETEFVPEGLDLPEVAMIPAKIGRSLAYIG
jgi:hypothetical protein